MTAAIPGPRRPATGHCLRHPAYWLASCDTCRQAQRAAAATR